MRLNLPKKLFRKLIYKTPVCRCWPGWSRVQGLVTRRGVCIMWWPVAAAPVVRGSAADLLTSIFSSNYFSAHSKQGVSCTHHHRRHQQVLSDRTFSRCTGGYDWAGSVGLGPIYIKNVKNHLGLLSLTYFLCTKI